MRMGIIWVLLVALIAPMAAAQESPRFLKAQDITALRGIDGPSINPAGTLVAYALKSIDVKKDRVVTNLWVASVDGSANRPLTFGDDDVSRVRFSPDGAWIGFLSSRNDENEMTQLWLLSVAGGEAQRVTSLPGGVEAFEWSPDSNRLVLVAHDPEIAVAGGEPIVIDRFQFKRDGEPYLTHRYSHLYLIDLKSKKPEPLTSGIYDDVLPSWSPDGTRIAFVSKRGPDPDRSDNYDIYVIDANIGAKERQLTSSIRSDADPNWDSAPAWSPDSKSIAFLQGGDPKKLEYATHGLAVVPAEGGAVRVLTSRLDRNLYSPMWVQNGIYAILEDDGSENIVKIDPKTGALEMITNGRRSVGSFDLSSKGDMALKMSTPQRPVEIFVLEKGEYRDVTKQNEAFIKDIKLGQVLETKFKSRDGTQVNGFIIRPPNGTNEKGPAILWLHGGPQMQYSNEFEFAAQVLAAAGYTVIMPNPRGSTGRGTDYAMGIYASWGKKDVQDNLAAVEDAIAKGFADPKRLGVGGWSYGGMATNYLIASTTRFKAAISGAAIANNLAGYGTDEYTYDYETELGVPWKNLDAWLRVSYPFFHADRIKTPTLFVVGAQDSNLAPHNSEQMYQALRSLKVATQLVVYPGQHHSITKPSFQIDRLERYLQWYAKWIK